MFKGYYMAASGMLTQSRVLNTVSNNMSNASTPGYKRDVLAATTFEDVLIHRTGNKDKSVYTPLANSASIKTADELVTDYTDGMVEFTDRKLDFALMGNSFFQIQTAGGENLYTKNGSFNIDGEGYLSLQHIGRVIGDNGPIYVGTDKINVNSQGQITNSETGELLGRFSAVEFADNANQLRKVEEGMFEAVDGANPTPADSEIMQGALERSNSSSMEEMLSMITAQRAFQSASQIAKAYDQIMGKVVEIAAL